MRTHRTQKQIVLTYLLRGKKLSQRAAMINWSIIRLSAIIHILRDEYGKENIITSLEPNSDRSGNYGEYYFEPIFLEELKYQISHYDFAYEK